MMASPARSTMTLTTRFTALLGLFLLVTQAASLNLSHHHGLSSQRSIRKPTSIMMTTTSPSTTDRPQHDTTNKNFLFHHQRQQQTQKKKNSLAASLVLCSVLFLSDPSSSVATAMMTLQDDSDAAVESAISTLQQSNNDPNKVFGAYESIASMITEGTGVGGMINYKGVQLERGYVADEDTSIYNPGLTLLTEGEKERLVNAVIAARKNGLATGNWNDKVQLGYEFLREKLDPLHMTELKGYLKVVPVYSAIVYLGVLAVQQLAPRSLFPVAYFVGVAAIFAPALVLVALGP